MRGILKLAKVSTLSTGRALGVFGSVRRSSWRAERLPILCYHGVSLLDEHQWAPSFYISPKTFHSRMEALARDGYRVLPLREAVELLYARQLPPRSAVITFDDGAADFVLRAVPILEQFGFPATVYLTTYYCGRNRPVFGVFCAYMLWRSRGRAIDLSAILGSGARWDLRSVVIRQQALAAINQHVERGQLSSGEQDELAKDIALRLGLDYDQLIGTRLLQLLAPDDVRQLSDRGIDFQLHTHRHRTPLDRTSFRRELADNARCLTEFSGKKPEHFCYPNGNYHPAFVAWLREEGIKTATTCDTGIASAASDPLLLPRVVDGEHLTAVEFESWLAGVGALVPRRPRGKTLL